MKRMSLIKLKFLCAVGIMFSLFSCEFEGGDIPAPLTCMTYIRFVSPSGENVLDSLNVVEKSENTPLTKADTTLISIRFTQESKKRSSSMQGNYFYARTKWDFPKDEILLKLEWIDFKSSSDYNEIYSIQLYSPKIFGDNETHTLKWYVNISGWRENAYKCEIDGHEVSLDNDPFYNENKFHDDDNRHPVAGIITINCK